mmetsp:Transcript_11064/g.20679  ORF Transcript_11064/g.20679 Transcript_11064/m.20679 type:complete len:318 (+) Transcript_11064:469-1422(+)
MAKYSLVVIQLLLTVTCVAAFTPTLHSISNSPKIVSSQRSFSMERSSLTQHFDSSRTTNTGMTTGCNRQHHRDRTQLTRINMVPTTGAAAVMGVISGGILGGALHAIAGPDHLAALLPRCCGQKWYRAGRIGALWGMGHGVSATILGLTAFGLKNRVSSMPAIKGLLIGASSAMEVAVGASLIFIGLLGIKEAKNFDSEEDSVPSSLVMTEGEEDGAVKAQKRAVVFNGILHGFSWDGAPSLAPALAVATWKGSISFLLAYSLGTMGAMSITTTLIGESTRRAGQILHRPDLPQKLSLVSSFLAIAVGAFWCYLAFK